jgi:hypothetical protein
MINQGLNENDYLEIKPFLVLLTHLIKNPGGDRAENRFEKTIIFFLEILEANISFYKFIETCFEYLFRLMSGVPAVL